MFHRFHVRCRSCGVRWSQCGRWIKPLRNSERLRGRAVAWILVACRALEMNARDSNDYFSCTVYDVYVWLDFKYSMYLYVYTRQSQRLVPHLMGDHRSRLVICSSLSHMDLSIQCQIQCQELRQFEVRRNLIAGRQTRWALCICGFVAVYIANIGPETKCTHH